MPSFGGPGAFGVLPLEFCCDKVLEFEEANVPEELLLDDIELFELGRLFKL